MNQKNKLDYLQEFWKDFFKYMENHKWQGRIIAFGFSSSLIIWSLAFNHIAFIKLIKLLSE